MADDFDFNELTQSEEPADALLRALGYQFIEPEAFVADREGNSDPILTQRLVTVLRRLNPWISDDNVHRAIRHIRNVTATGLIEANERAYIALTHGVSLEQDFGTGRQGRTVRYVDFDDLNNNEFVFTRQYRVAGTRGQIIPDLVVFVNGIPLVVIECKSPAIDDPIEEGVKRLIRYQELTDDYKHRGAPRLFHVAQILITACGQAARYATVGTPPESWAEWKAPYPLKLDELQRLTGRIPNPQDVLIAGLLQRENLLDLVRNFNVFEVSQGQTVRKIARYQQFIAVNEAIQRIQTGQRPDARGGVIWHTQGSGKSLTMVFMAVKLRRLKEAANPTLVIVTDRTDLDDQIAGTFERCGFPNPEQARSVRELRQLLTEGSGRTITTTVQKFQDATAGRHPVLNGDKNVFVFVDEAHRTQYKELAANMRRALPNACFIGFTGTPIDKRDRSTLRTFGEYIHTYTIEQSVADGATVPIFYEMRNSRDRVSGDDLDAAFERIFSNRSPEQRERIKQHYGKKEFIAAAPERVERIARDIVEHYTSTIQPNGFKAQVVAVNRRAAAAYKEAFERLGAPESALIVSFGNDDDALITKWATSKGQQRRLIERFKDQDDPLALLVACDMLLTGFDAPVEQVLYLDAPLKEHTLLQAIARVNRPALGKDYGLVVDYWSVVDDLESALSIFEPSEVAGALRPKLDELSRLESRHRTILRFFSSVDRHDVEACLRVLEPEDVRTEFNFAFQRFSQSMDMLLPDPAALPYVADLKWLGKIRNAARVRFRDDRLSLIGCREKVRALIEEYIASDGVEQLLEPISILAPEFEARVAALTSDEAKASEMEHAIRHEIQVHLDENPMFYAGLRERLEAIILSRRQARIDTATQLRLFHDLRGNLDSVQDVAERVGLDETGYAVYTLLDGAAGVGQAGRHEFPNDRINPDRRDLATAILSDLRELVVVDWVQKEDVQRRMRQAIKRRLRGTAVYDAGEVEALTTRLLDLARVRLGA